MEENTKSIKPLTFALAKGRIADDALDLLAQAGVALKRIYDKQSRKLIYADDALNLKFFLAKAPDVPTYVEYGAADVGIVGSDILREENRRVYELLDLKIGNCQMCVCGFPQAAKLLESNEMIRVASKYTNIARDYFLHQKGQSVDIIKLNGSVELGPIIALSDVIVDIVETGSTLAENGLSILEEIMPISARLIVNQVSLAVKRDRIKEIVKAIEAIV